MISHFFKKLTPPKISQALVVKVGLGILCAVCSILVVYLGLFYEPEEPLDNSFAETPSLVVGGNYSGEQLTVSSEVQQETSIMHANDYADARAAGRSYIQDFDPTTPLISSGIALTKENILMLSNACLSGASTDENGFNCLTGLNEQGCTADGLNALGEPCIEESAAELCASEPYDEFGKDAWGFFADGYNEDQRDRQGFTRDGCGLDGRTRSGEPCGEPIYGPDGFSQYGRTIDGFDRENCGVDGFDRANNPCGKPIYGPDGYSQYGFDIHGLDKDLFDESGCSSTGFDRNNNPCGKPIYGPDGYSQYGLDEAGFARDNFNTENCNRQGVSRDGTLCDRIFESDGFDQFGFNAEHKNRLGEDRFQCNELGLTPDGIECSQALTEAEILDRFIKEVGLTVGANDALCVNGYNSQGIPCGEPIYGPDGFSQYGRTIDGFDKEHCGLDGYSRTGEPCGNPVYNVHGVDQYGRLSNGVLAVTGCGIDGFTVDGKPCGEPIFGADGFSQYGRTVEGFDRSSCGIDGYNRSGEPCGLPVIGEDGFDQYGRTATGEMCGPDGRLANGEPCGEPIYGPDGFSQYGRTEDGFDRLNCGIDGYDRTGQPCGPSIYGEDGLDQYGLLPTGFTPDGFDIRGFNEHGCSRDNLTPEGEYCNRNAKWISDNLGADGRDRLGFLDGLNVLGFRENGLSESGFDRHNCDENMMDPDGFSCITGLDDDGFDVNNCSDDGYTRTGERCERVPFTPVYDESGFDSRGFSQAGRDADLFDIFGYGPDGFSKANIDRLGCTRDNKDLNGFDCTTGLDDDGYDIDGFNTDSINRSGLRRDGRTIDGFDPITGLNELMVDRDGCTAEGRRLDGTICSQNIAPELTMQELDLYSQMLNWQDALLLELQDSMVVGTSSMTATPFEAEMQGEDEFASTSGTYGQPVYGDQVAYSPNNEAYAIAVTPEQADEEPEVRIPERTVLRGAVSCEINTDYAGDACVRIEDGPLAGAEFLGTYEVPFLDDTTRPRDRIMISFDRMVFNRQTFNISANAVDTDTMAQYLASDINYHTAYRWGGVAAAATFDMSKLFMLASVANYTDDSSSTAASTTAMVLDNVVSSPLDDLTEKFSDRWDREPTVTMYIGEPVGVVFTQPVVDERLPYIFE